MRAVKPCVNTEAAKITELGCEELSCAQWKHIEEAMSHDKSDRETDYSFTGEAYQTKKERLKNPTTITSQCISHFRTKITRQSAKLQIRRAGPSHGPCNSTIPGCCRNRSSRSPSSLL